MRIRFLSLPNQFRMFRYACAAQILRNRFMGIRLTNKDELAAVCDYGFAHRLLGIEIVSKVNRLEISVFFSVLAQPTLRGGWFAILLVMPILRRYEFRRQRYDMLVSWSHKRRSKKGMEILF